MATTSKAARTVSGLRVALAVTCLVVGVTVLLWPRLTVLVVAVLFGIELIIAGGVRVALATVERSSPGRRILAVVLGFLTIIAGLICLLRPSATLFALAIVIALGWFIDGVSEIASGLRRNRTAQERLGGLLFGALSLVAGLIVLLFPDQTLVLFARIGGVVLIGFGLVTLLSAAAARRVRTTEAARA
jgi:uncharacterized membrane protein HdeD (DUF308 family)